MANLSDTLFNSLSNYLNAAPTINTNTLHHQANANKLNLNTFGLSLSTVNDDSDKENSDQENQPPKKKSKKEKVTIDDLIQPALFSEGFHLTDEQLYAANRIANYIRDAYHNIENRSDHSRKKLNSIFREFNERFITHGKRIFKIDAFKMDYGHLMKNEYHYMAGVGINDRFVYKIIHCDDSIFSTFMILKEIAFQQYAYSLSARCNLVIPNIIDYGKVNFHPTEHQPQGFNRFNATWYIQMDRIPFPNLESQIGDAFVVRYCNEISNRINHAIQCLKENGLYHNDSHTENIFLDLTNQNMQIGLIDYDRAEVYNDQLFVNTTYDCNRLTTKSRKTKGGKTKRRKTKRRKTKRVRLSRKFW